MERPRTGPASGGTKFPYFYFTMVGRLIVFVHAIKKKRGRMPSLGTLQKIADALGVQVVLRPGQAVTVEPFLEQKAAWAAGRD